MKLTMDQALDVGDVHAKKLAAQAVQYLARQKLEGHVTVILHLRAEDDPDRPGMIPVMTVGAGSAPPHVLLPMVHNWAEDQIAKISKDEA